VSGAADRAFGAQVLTQFLLQHAARLNIKASIDDLPLGTLLRNTLPISACDTCLCASAGNVRLSQPATCSGDHLRRSFADTAWPNAGWQASLHGLGRRARFHAA
jgi:hypothetical protein